LGKLLVGKVSHYFAKVGVAVVDLTADDPTEQVEGVLKKLEQSNLILSREEKEIDYEELNGENSGGGLEGPRCMN
jgi:hypothetical protein